MRSVRYRNLETWLLHGFPSIRSRQNREIADVIARRTCRPAEVLLYEGLSAPGGPFRFSQCLNAVMNEFTAVASEPQNSGSRFDLVGHSWGGYVAIRLATGPKARHIRRMVFMSPLLGFPDEVMVYRELVEFTKEQPGINLGDLQELAKDFVELRNQGDPMDLVSQIPSEIEILFLQAKNDTTTPASKALQALAKFKGDVTFEEIETDHSFVKDRPLICERIAEFLARK